MRIKLVFDDWRKMGKSVYHTLKGVELAENEFHSGTTFDGQIEVTPEQEKELEQFIKEGYQPVFWVTQDDKPKRSVAVRRKDKRKFVLRNMKLFEKTDWHILLRKARRELGYSNKTVGTDILYGLKLIYAQIRRGE